MPYQGPPGSTELLLVRHGASTDAVEGEDFELLEGHGNPALSDIGREQAEFVGVRLARQQFEALYVTTLRRTAETAAPLVRTYAKCAWANGMGASSGRKLPTAIRSLYG